MSQYQRQRQSEHFISKLNRLGLKRLASVTGTRVEVQGPTKTGNLGLVHLRIVTTADKTITLGATGNRSGGVKVAELPEIGVLPQAARIRGELTLTGATATASAGEVGLGSAAASAGAATLSGTSEDLMEGVAGTAIEAAATVEIDVLSSGAHRPLLDKRDNGLDVHFNMATEVGVATTNATLKAGAIIDLWFMGLAD